MERACIIGAGSSGIASCQVLHARGIEFECFEQGSGVGGNWRYGNDNGMSSAYKSLFINTSRRIMEYAAYPMPDDLPDHPHHTQNAAYFDDYVDHFGFRDKIRFNTEVTSVEPTDDGRWEVTARGASAGGHPASSDDGTTGSYRWVLVANGHHWNPRWPEPPFPGEFDGDVVHAHYYRTSDGFEDKNVLIVGFGNSAMDIACETSRVSTMTYLSTRRGGWVIPKYLGDKPVDEIGSPKLSRLPLWAGRWLYGSALKKATGRMEEWGLPKPDHKLLAAHPTISSDLLPRIGHGRVKPKPNIERLEGGSVRFVDGSVEQIDKIVYCTGYKITFPFLRPDLVDPADNAMPTYRRVFHPDLPGLAFIGLLQPLGAIMPLAEVQSAWVADMISGESALPSAEEMRREIARDDARMRKRYVASPRHTIQVDFYPYIHTVERERKRGRRRAHSSGGGTAADRPTEAHAGAPA